jgi:hypothetical protein
MVNAVSTTTPVQTAHQPAKPPEQRQQTKAASPAVDTVQISSAALTALAAKPPEATETFSQTRKGGSEGNPKTIAMLAKYK